MEIDVLAGNIQPVDRALVAKAQERFDNLIKPVGSLAKLEEMATRYAAIYGSADKNDVNFPQKTLLVWTAEPEQAAAYMQDGKAACVLADNAKISRQSFLVTAETTEEALLEGALLVKEAASCTSAAHNSTVTAACRSFFSASIIDATTIATGPVVPETIGTLGPSKPATKQRITAPHIPAPAPNPVATPKANA